MKAYITDIQRFSLRDGDGIRTTVFLKGCNMKCPWCHNPETIGKEPDLMFYKDKCIGCGKCFEVCPLGAHKTENNQHIIDRNICTNCGKCAEVCPNKLIVMLPAEQKYAVRCSSRDTGKLTRAVCKKWLYRLQAVREEMSRFSYICCG